MRYVASTVGLSLGSTGASPGPSTTTDNNPFRGLERSQRQFEDALRMWDPDEFGTTESGMGTIGVDLADRGDEFVLTAGVPGFERDDIDLRLSDNTVHVDAERERDETEERDEFYDGSERERRSMSRSVRLPEPVDGDAVEASHRNGVLTVTLPKEEPTAVDGRSIEVE